MICVSLIFFATLWFIGQRRKLTTYDKAVQAQPAAHTEVLSLPANSSGKWQHKLCLTGMVMCNYQNVLSKGMKYDNGIWQKGGGWRETVLPAFPFKSESWIPGDMKKCQIWPAVVREEEPDWAEISKAVQENYPNHLQGSECEMELPFFWLKVILQHCICRLSCNSAHVCGLSSNVVNTWAVWWWNEVESHKPKTPLFSNASHSYFNTLAFEMF